MNLLPWTIYLSFLGSVLILCCPGRATTLPRLIALVTAIGTLAISLYAGSGYHPLPGQETVNLVNLPWVPALGITYHLSADGISLVLVVLTALASVAGVLFSWNISQRTRGFFSLYLLLISGVFGVFLSRDAFLFFVFYEIAIVPKYFLIAIWGSTNRRYGAMKLALYSFVGSAMVLVGLLVAAVAAHVKTGGPLSFDVETLSRAGLDASMQHWLFPLVFVGFAILAGMWPFHTWAPTGHVAAPTAASMLLAGVVMKLGAYGCLRVAMPLFPAGLHDWQTFFAILAAIGICWGALAALVQTDFKFVIGYSSVSHMGFVLLGVLALNRDGLTGGVLQMFSHGIVAGLLFAVVGRMVYDRTHTRDLTALGKMRLLRTMPFAAVVFVLAGLASMGLPGFSGFVAELSVLMGAWNAFPSITLVAAIGIPLAAAYTLRAFNRTFFAEVEAGTPEPDHPFEPPTWPEVAGVLLLLAATIYAGLCPGTLIQWIHAGLDSTLMHGLTGGLS